MILSTIPIMKLSLEANKTNKREKEGGEREREGCCQLVRSFCYKCLFVTCFRVVVKSIGFHLLYIVCVCVC